MPLLEARKTYKPFEYPWAYEYWKIQQQIHWMPEEVPLSEDIRDWNQKITPEERNLLTQIFRFFTQADVEVQDCYHDKYGRVFKPTEIKMMLAAFSNMECFDDRSELLTATGWKNVADITVSDRIAQYDMVSQQVSFVEPKKVVNYDYKGVMHHYKSQTTDIMVTPNHDLIGRHPVTGKVDKRKSYERLWGKNYTYPASGLAIGTDSDLSSMDRLLIAAQADGCFRGMCPSAGDWHTVDFTLHKKRKIERLQRLLGECDIEHSIKMNDAGRTVITFNMPHEIDVSKIRDFDLFDISAFSSGKAAQFLDEVIFWDGTINSSTGQRAYYTRHPRAAGFVQALASITGASFGTVGINRLKGAEVTLPGDRPHTLQSDHLVVTLTEGRIEKTYPHRTEVDYNGKVYCVSVDTENLVSRRNGKVAFTGNTVHIAAYSHLLDTIGMDEAEYGAFLEYEAMRDKHDFLQRFNTDSDMDIARTLAGFGAFTEGLQLFASFTMLMNFPRFNKMKGMGQIVSWSVRDESLHCEGIIRLFHAFCAERGLTGNRALRDDLHEMCYESVNLEDGFIDLAFEMGPVQGMTAPEIKQYIRFIADWRLKQLKLEPLFNVGDHPLPWLGPLLNGVEHANFFEARATEYSKAATRGTWQDTWARFDEKRLRA